MKRRAFLQSSAPLALIGSTALAGVAAGPEGGVPPREIYELRTYTPKPGKKPMLDDYLSKAFIPALKRAGIGPVGVFSETGAAGATLVHVLIVFKSGGLAATLGDRLAADAEHAKAAAEFLAATAAEPVYDRIESSLLGAIAACPKLEKTDTTKPRLMNLRIYESHNERAAAKKIEMFNKHELAVFRRVGLTPVFFAGALVGARLPNLTYMLVFPDDDARKAAWDRFRADDEWKKLKAMPEYADKEIVSRITNKILTPEPYSEI